MLRKVSCLQGLSCLTGTIWETEFPPILCKCEVRCLFFYRLCIGSSLLPHSLFKLERNCTFPRLPSLQSFLSVCHFLSVFLFLVFPSILSLLNSHSTVRNCDDTGLSSFVFSSGDAWVSRCFFSWVCTVSHSGASVPVFLYFCNTPDQWHPLQSQLERKHTLASA